MTQLQQTIEAAFERRDSITPGSVDAATKAAILEAIDLLDSGKARVAEKIADDAAHPARVHVHGGISARGDEAHVRAVLIGKLLHRRDDILCEVGEARGLVLELHRPCVVPADLEEIGEEHFEPLHLSVQQLKAEERYAEDVF